MISTKRWTVLVGSVAATWLSACAGDDSALFTTSADDAGADASSGGGASSGGASSGGASSGGASSGGAASTGGASSGGANAGGANTGGVNSGGASAGGANAGGAGTGGAAGGQGGAGTGGAGTGGAGTGGAGTGGATGGQGGAGGAGGQGGAGGAGGCGNGVVDASEECDRGLRNDDNASGDCSTACRTSCHCPFCGDSVTDFALGEECDDGNSINNDGCSSCTIDAPSTCGDGTLDLDQGEECDDNGQANGDGCDSSCQLEPVGQTCGDGTTDTLEKCDDGNTVSGDTCSATCNLDGSVTTLMTGLGGDLIALDNQYLYLGTNAGSGTCEIQQLDLMPCINSAICNLVTLAGGACGAPADGNGTSAVLTGIEAMTTDGTTLWFGNQHTIRALNLSTGDVTTVAGDVNRCGAIDGNGTSAYFHDVRGLTYHRGYVYLLDGCEEVLRRFDPATGDVVTLAGQRQPDPGIPQTGANAYQCQGGFSCVSPTPADGQGLAALFGSPRYMTPDNAGNLYITDTNGQLIRTYNIRTGWVGTLVGSTPGYTDTAQGAVQIGRPRGITSDGTSVYWGEQVASTVRQAVIQTGATSTLIGVRGCPGARPGQGGDGTIDWSIPGCGTAPNTTATITSPFGGIAFHYPSQSLLVVESGRLRRVQ